MGEALQTCTGETAELDEEYVGPSPSHDYDMQMVVKPYHIHVSLYRHTDIDIMNHDHHMSMQSTKQQQMSSLTPNIKFTMI